MIHQTCKHADANASIATDFAVTADVVTTTTAAAAAAAAATSLHRYSFLRLPLCLLLLLLCTGTALGQYSVSISIGPHSIRSSFKTYEKGAVEWLEVKEVKAQLMRQKHWQQWWHSRQLRSQMCRSHLRRLPPGAA